MLLVKKFGKLIKQKIFLFVFYLITILFCFESYKYGIFIENGVSSGFTPFFVSIGIFLITTILLFKEQKTNLINIRNAIIVIFGVILFWLFLTINPFLLCFFVGIFSFIVSNEEKNKKIKYSLVLTILCFVFILLLKLLGIEIA